MAEVRFEQATRTYPGGEAPAVDALDLTIADGEFMVLVGPSGSGKTTALRMLAGLEEVDAGAVLIDGRDVSDDAPKRRDVAMVFQNYALYPYLTVAANIAFPLRMAKVPRAERDARVRDVAELLELTPFLERKPGQLSGGQRQRVAMGRAIVRKPRVFLMDEPLSNLDAKLRVQMRADIAELQARLGITTVYVTHDQAEAMTLGHRVAVLKDARLQQCDTPRVLFDRPANTFVAGFVGSPAMNLCRVAHRANGSPDVRRDPHRAAAGRGRRGRRRCPPRGAGAGGRRDRGGRGGGRGARLGRVPVLCRGGRRRTAPARRPRGRAPRAAARRAGASATQPRARAPSVRRGERRAPRRPSEFLR